MCPPANQHRRGKSTIFLGKPLLYHNINPGLRPYRTAVWAPLKWMITIWEVPPFDKLGFIDPGLRLLTQVRTQSRSWLMVIPPVIC